MLALGYMPGRLEPPQGQIARSWSYKGVPITIDRMRELVHAALQREQSVRRLAEQITAGLTPKDYLSEIAALYYYVLTNVRYMRDPAHVEYVKNPLVLLAPEIHDRANGRRAGQDDCEGLATTLAALCMSVGNRAEFVTISTQYGVGFHHVFTVVVTPEGLKIVLDPVAGPDADEMLRSIVRHQVWPIEPVIQRDGTWGIASARPVAGGPYLLR